MNKIRLIHVGKVDFKNGMIFNCKMCPIALSIKRTLRTYGAEVNQDNIRFTSYTFGCQSMSCLMLTPKWLADIINRIDRKLYRKPFDFYIHFDECEMPIAIKRKHVKKTR